MNKYHHKKNRFNNNNLRLLLIKSHLLILKAQIIKMIKNIKKLQHANAVIAH